MTGFFVVLLSGLLISGSHGWGQLFTSYVLPSTSNTDSQKGFFILNCSVGIGMFTVLGGILVAFNIAYVPLLLSWHFIGALVQLIILVRTGSIAPKQLLVKIRTNATLVVTSFCSAVLCIGYVSIRRFLSYDDYPAYLYLANKLSVTGGLIDPFNNRRVLSYGASTLYQSMYLSLTGTQSIFSFDNLFGCLLLAISMFLLLLYFNVNKFYSAVISILVVVGSGSALQFNLSPRFFISFLTLALLFMSYLYVKTESESEKFRLVIFSAIVLSALFATRSVNAILPMSAVVLVLLASKTRFRSLLRLFAVFVASTLAWSIALYESSKTFLYPLMRGTASPGYGISPLHWGVSKYLKVLIEILNSNGIWIILLVSGISAAALLKSDLFSSIYWKLFLFGFSGLLLEVITSVFSLKGYDPWEISRFIGPSILGFGLFLVVLLFAMYKDAEFVVREKSFGSAFDSFMKKPILFLKDRITVILATYVVVVVTMGIPQSALTSDLNGSPLFVINAKTSAHNLFSYFVDGAKALISSNNLTDNLTLNVPNFMRISALLPSGSHVLAAVETPSLLDTGRLSVATLDFPGANSPSPGMPLNKGPEATMTYLHNLGYTYVVAESPNAPYDLYTRDQALKDLNNPWYNYRSTASGIITWDSLINSIVSSGHYSEKFINGYVVINTKYSVSVNTSSSDIKAIKQFLTGF